MIDYTNPLRPLLAWLHLHRLKRVPHYIIFFIYVLLYFFFLLLTPGTSSLTFVSPTSFYLLLRTEQNSAANFAKC